MSEAVWTAILTGAFSLLISWGTVFVMLRKAPSEIQGNEANASKSNAEAAIALTDGLVRRVERLETELAAACTQVEDLQKHVKTLESDNSLLRDWAERLAHQVISLGGTPVAMKNAARPIKGKE